jgi:hypothetical protein
MAQDEPSHIAPEGASCAEHPDRIAQFTCPRCQRHACIACFHPAVARCARCLKQDPTEAAPPLPFESKEGNALSRYLRTFGTAFFPSRTAPAMAYPELRPALTFFWLSSLPLAMLAGVIPHTRTLGFGNMQITLLGQPLPAPADIAIDVARAIGAQLVLSGVELACLLLPFVSLVGAYAPERRTAATRVVLYRFWLAPAAALIGYLAAWVSPIPLETLVANPEQMPPMPILIAGFAQAALRVFQILSLTATARLACGLSIPMSLVVVGVPLILQILAVPLAALGLERVLPVMPTQR